MSCSLLDSWLSVHVYRVIIKKLAKTPPLIRSWLIFRFQMSFSLDAIFMDIFASYEEKKTFGRQKVLSITRWLQDNIAVFIKSRELVIFFKRCIGLGAGDDNNSYDVIHQILHYQCNPS